eukprot:scaffold86281_cov27-Tisochrysis_lutea.AAC.7
MPSMRFPPPRCLRLELHEPVWLNGCPDADLRQLQACPGSGEGERGEQGRAQTVEAGPSE